MMAAVPAGRTHPRLAFSLALAVVLAAQLSCTRRPAVPVLQRLAVLRFENLGSDPAADWVGRALEEILDTELAGAPELYAIPSSRLLAMDRALGARPVMAPGISAGRAAALSLGATRIGYGDYAIRNGRLEVHLSLADPRTGRRVAELNAEGGAGDVLAAGAALARQISAHASGYPTRSEAALRAYIDALDAAGPAEAESQAEAALDADPAFGPAARLLAGLMAQRGDRDGALACLNRAMAHAAGMPAIEQARLRLDAATLENQPAERQQALATVAAAEPANPEAWLALGDFAFSRRHYGAAQPAFRRAAELDPTQPAALNQAAYAAAFAGHPDEALADLRRCQALRPSDPNTFDSLGDVQLLIGHPREAEAFYLQAAKRDAHFLNGADWLKAAMARLMTGDRAGADGLSEKYVQARFAAEDPAADLYRGQWRFLSGRRREGYGDLEAIARREGNGAARGLAVEAHAQLAIWSLFLGDRAAAQAHARAALGTVPAAALAAFLAGPPASLDEWSARAEKLAPRPEQASIRDFALGQALLLGKQFAAAVPVLRRAYQNSAPTNPEMPVLLAWAYLETGQTADAAPLLALNPIPPPAGIDAFASCWFPRLFFLRGQAAEKQGRTDVARANYKLFLELSGDSPFQWGEEDIARASLERQ
ncbi:MAG: tetratricopeptide repeat protein [Bryobacteraceae bacterium]|jgi:tetratricopeptide (TPR) repeat protein